MDPIQPIENPSRMRLEYAATLDDVAAPTIRFYLRGKSYASQRFKEPLIMGLAGVGAYYLITSSRPVHLWWSYFVFFALIFCAKFFDMKRTVSQRIRNYIKREKEHLLPTPVTYDITDTHLFCNFFGVDTVYSLDSITEIKEEAERLEIWVGDTSLSTIPLRAFRDEAHKAQFVSLLKRQTLSL